MHPSSPRAGPWCTRDANCGVYTKSEMGAPERPGEARTRKGGFAGCPNSETWRVHSQQVATTGERLRRGTTQLPSFLMSPVRTISSRSISRRRRRRRIKLPRHRVRPQFTSPRKHSQSDRGFREAGGNHPNEWEAFCGLSPAPAPQETLTGCLWLLPRSY